VGTRKERSLHIKDVIDGLASCQHGVVSRGQLLRAEVPAHIIDHRVATRRLRVVHRGVYRVGPLSVSRMREMAAVLACGGAPVSHRSAAGMWQMLPPLSEQQPVDILVAGGDRGRRRGIRIHRARALSPDETTRLDGMAITTPTRTLIDLASVVAPRDLEKAVAFAERESQTTRAALLALLVRRPLHAGSRELRSLLEENASPALTRSEAEERMLALIRKARLRSPEVNARVAGCEVDFLWRSERLVVEVDGYAYHASPRSFELERQRDAVLTAAGMRVVRVTWRQIVAEPEATLVRLAQALARLA
jgi:very-short-patch-repair endonuclease